MSLKIFSNFYRSLWLSLLNFIRLYWSTSVFISLYRLSVCFCLSEKRPALSVLETETKIIFEKIVKTSNFWFLIDFDGKRCVLKDMLGSVTNNLLITVKELKIEIDRKVPLCRFEEQNDFPHHSCVLQSSSFLISY